MRGKNILVTGGAGFIGSHLCEALLHRGDAVAVVDDLSTGSLSNLRGCLGSERFSFARASILNEPVMDRLMSEASAVIHLAAAVGVQLIVEDPVRTIETNVLGTHAVLETALRYGVKTLIVSTSEVYGKGARIPFAEDDDILLGSSSRSRWSYAASKLVDEFLGLAYQSKYDLPVVLFRLFNTVGPRQTGTYGMVIPRFMSQALQNKPVTVYGDGTQSRCFCHVNDVVRAVVGLLDSPTAVGKVYNIGGTEEVTMLELARRAIDVAGTKAPIQLIPYSEAYGPGFEDMSRRVPNTSRIEALLGWSPTLPLDRILTDVRDWLRSNGPDLG